jgi:hypothetical protein
MKKPTNKLADTMRAEYDLRALLKGGVRGKYAKRYHEGTKHNPDRRHCAVGGGPRWSRNRSAVQGDRRERKTTIPVRVALDFHLSWRSPRIPPEDRSAQLGMVNGIVGIAIFLV